MHAPFEPHIVYSATRSDFDHTVVYDLWQVVAYQSLNQPGLYEWRTGPDWGTVVEGADLLNDLWSKFVAHHGYEVAATYE